MSNGESEQDHVEWLFYPESDDEPQIPMPWSFGPLGDIVWLTLPSCRADLVETAYTHLRTSLPALQPLDQITEFTLLVMIVQPWTQKVLLDPDLTWEREQLVRFLQTVIKHLSQFEYAINMYYLDGLQDPPYPAALRELSPELYRAFFNGAE
ncbi:hypothetical protein [Micromonospora sp. NPDC049679]|uniref:hypothetical protein n=1 Tax=Micromonospora sp. NPDC049679 TaxID=3155920 RepID=UPI0033D3E2BB